MQPKESNLELKLKTIAYLQSIVSKLTTLSWDILEADDESVDDFMDCEMPKIRQLELTKVHNSLETAKTDLHYLIENLTQEVEYERLREESAKD